jgi:hypothetical protein
VLTVTEKTRVQWGSMLVNYLLKIADWQQQYFLKIWGAGGLFSILYTASSIQREKQIAGLC